MHKCSDQVTFSEGNLDKLGCEAVGKDPEDSQNFHLRPCTGRPRMFIAKNSTKPLVDEQKKAPHSSMKRDVHLHDLQSPRKTRRIFHSWHH